MSKIQQEFDRLFKKIEEDFEQDKVSRKDLEKLVVWQALLDEKLKAEREKNAIPTKPVVVCHRLSRRQGGPGGRAANG